MSQKIEELLFLIINNVIHFVNLVYKNFLKKIF